MSQATDGMDENRLGIILHIYLRSGSRNQVDISPTYYRFTDILNTKYTSPEV